MVHDKIIGTGVDGTTTPVGQDEPIRWKQGDKYGIIGTQNVDVKMTREMWGNKHWIAGVECEAVLRAYLPAATNVLELGTGWTTIVLDQAKAERPALGVTSLEHSEEWYWKVMNYIKHVTVVLAPLAKYLRNGVSFEWYQTDDFGDPSTHPPIDLVLVDGPPRGTTEGGRSGAMPLLHQRLAYGAILIIDDATLESPMIIEWMRDYPLHLVEQIYGADRERVLVLEYLGPNGVDSVTGERKEV